MAVLLWSAAIILAIGGLAATTIIDDTCGSKTSGSHSHDYTPVPSTDLDGITLEDPVPKFTVVADCTSKVISSCSFSGVNTLRTSDSKRFQLKDKTSQKQKSCFFRCQDGDTKHPRLFCVNAYKETVPTFSIHPQAAGNVPG